MEETIDTSYDENDIEDFEEYLEYYGFEETFGDEEDEEEHDDDNIKELYF